MPHRANITREIQTQNAKSGAIQYTSSAVTTTPIACFIQQNSGFESRQNMRETGSRSYTVFFDVGTDVRSTDRIIPVTGSPQAGSQLIVESPPDTWTSRYVMVSASLQDGRIADVS